MSALCVISQLRGSVYQLDCLKLTPQSQAKHSSSPLKIDSSSFVRHKRTIAIATNVDAYLPASSGPDLVTVEPPKNFERYPLATGRWFPCNSGLAKALVARYQVVLFISLCELQTKYLSQDSVLNLSAAQTHPLRSQLFENPSPAMVPSQ